MRCAKRTAQQAEATAVCMPHSHLKKNLSGHLTNSARNLSGIAGNPNLPRTPL